MNIENILAILGSNFVASILTFILTRRKMSAETDNQVLQNLELSINLYKELIDSLKTEIESLNIKIQHLEIKMDEVMMENRKLKSSL